MSTDIADMSPRRRIATNLLCVVVLLIGLATIALPERALAQSQVLSGTTVGGPTFNPPRFISGVCAPNMLVLSRYATHEITIFDTPSEILIAQSNFDNIMHLYPAGGFNPNNACTNLIASDDDGGPGLSARLVGDFPPGDYIVVVTGFGTASGTYTMELTNVVTTGTPIPQPDPLTLALSQSNLLATQGSAIVPVTATAGGGTPPYAFTIDPPLPGGLTLDPDTGTITGTPTAAQPQTAHTVTVTDSADNTSTAVLDLTVLDEPHSGVPAQPTQPIPTLSAPALLVLATLVGLIGWRQRREHLQGQQDTGTYP